MSTLEDHQVHLGVFLGVLVIVIMLGFWAARWRQAPNRYSLEEWGLGGRSFGPVLTWFLVGGDMYSAYTFVALPAAIYGVGAFNFWPVLAIAIVYPLVLVAATRMWSVTHVHGMVTSADFVRARFGSRILALMVAVAGIYLLVHYMALQLVGIEAVFETMGLTGVWPLWAAFGIIAVFTYNAGLRAPALMSIVKDVLVLWLLLAAVLVVASTGGWSSTFTLAANRFQNTPSPADGLVLLPSSMSAYITTAVGSAFALFVCPHVLTGILAAKNRASVRIALAGLPIYSVAMVVIGLLGFAAIARGITPVGFDVSTGSRGNPFTIAPRLFDEMFPDWVAGTAFAAIVIGAFVPAAVMSIAAANLFARNIYKEFLRPNASPKEQTRVSQITSFAVKFLAAATILVFGLQFSIDTGAVIILQTLPAVGIGLFSRWPHRYALLGGLAGGLAAAFVMLYQIPQLGPGGVVVKAHFGGTNWALDHLGIHTVQSVYVGFAALGVNLFIVVLATPVLRLLRVPDGEDLTRRRSYRADEGDPLLRRLDEILDGRPVESPNVQARVPQRSPYDAPSPAHNHAGAHLLGRHEADRATRR